MKAILDKLGIKDVNPGACTGPDGWIEDPKGTELVSHNPASGKPIAKIIQATPASYETVISAAHEAFETWRRVPAPQRGQVVRDLGIALRELKEPLGDLVQPVSEGLQACMHVARQRAGRAGVRRAVAGCDQSQPGPCGA